MFCFKCNKFVLQFVFFAYLAREIACVDDYDYFPLNYRKPEFRDGKSIGWPNHKTIGNCGGVHRDRQVIVESTDYPSPYPSNLHCVYTFASPFVCTSEFHIQFLDFELESSPNCTKDRLVIGSREVLCGKVIGIMKYEAPNGILRIDFSTDELGQEKGFKLLVTRLPCDDDFSTNSISSTSAAPPPTTEPAFEIFAPVQVDDPFPASTPQPPAAPWNGAVPAHEFEVPANSLPSFNTQSFLVPAQRPFPAGPDTAYLPSSPGLQQPQPPALNVPNCCVNPFHQRRFYLVSAAFPYSGTQRSDCVYHLQRNNPNVCRLRIEFKYFLLGQPHESQTNCPRDFLEIDGQRICGCKTGLIYTSQWLGGDKIVRYSNTFGLSGNQGFVLDVVQEECPLKRSALIRQPEPRFIRPFRDFNRCYLNYGDWLSIASNQFFLSKPVCIKNIA